MMPALLKKILLGDLWEGLRVTFRNQNPKYIYTEQYPAQRPVVPERYRGAPRLRNDPATGKTLCNGCGACALACPENLIVVGSERNPETKKKELVTYTFDLSRCMFCGLCQEACPTDAIVLTQGFELAMYSREGQIWDRPRLEEGLKPTVYKC
jgi:NADH-quinone oxidoreductase subunit I